MNKVLISVPAGIRYISDWKGYDLRNYAFPHILNKVLTGCGYTEYCIRNNQDLILCSPRKILLENKEDQHPGEVYYARSGLENFVNFEKDLLTIKAVSENKQLFSEEEKKRLILEFKNRILTYVRNCRMRGIPCKILVTYDSFRHVKDALGELIKEFQIVIDEFQSILVDAKFKSTTEIEFLYQLLDLQNICFVSATPLLDKYLNKLDEFKNLPYYEFDWITEEPGRITKPEIKVRTYTRSLTEEIGNVIKKYQEGKFERYLINDSGTYQEILSTEAVIYVNSVKTICSVIKRFNLLPENTNVLCARTPENEDKIRLAFNEVFRKTYPDNPTIRLKKGKKVIGSIPKRGDHHKMFTLCTRTVYLGADFYNKFARTFIFSDANIDCLSVDVSMDLEQILGRQRLDENPWKNQAELYIKLSTFNLTKEDFDRELERKIKTTNDLLKGYNNNDDLEVRHALANTFQKVAKSYNYKDDYVAVNHHAGSDLKPVFNNLMMIADERIFEIQQIDYKDRFSVFNALGKYEVEDDEINQLVSKFNEFSKFTDKMLFVCDLEKIIDQEHYLIFLDAIPSEFKNFVITLGTDEIKACSYQKTKILSRFDKVKSVSDNQDQVTKRILNSFSVGSRYLKSDIKSCLETIYTEEGYNKTPKAKDIENYFNTKPVLFYNKETGKRDAGFEILSKKL